MSSRGSWLPFSASWSPGLWGVGGAEVGSVGAEILLFGERNVAGVWWFGWGQRGHCWMTLKPWCPAATWLLEMRAARWLPGGSDGLRPLVFLKSSWKPGM